MTHTSPPYSYGPDLLLMELPKNSMELRLQAFESPWGTTDEILCYWQDILLGQLVGDNGKFMKLLPNLDRKRDYPWPSAEAFESTIVKIIRQFPNLEVRCERDCDQHPVKRIATIEGLLENMDLVLSYCLGAQTDCPSFSYNPEM